MCIFDPTAYRVWRSRYYGSGGGIHSKYYRCNGYVENRLSQCVSYNEIGSRTHSDDVGIYCYYGTYKLHYHSTYTVVICDCKYTVMYNFMLQLINYMTGIHFYIISHFIFCINCMGVYIYTWVSIKE